MGEQFDYSTLKWVKKEIDDTLTQARQALEAYVENPEDETQLRFCVTYLHQVRGTLQMVELYGAVMLAEEMEQLAQALLDKEIAQKTDAYEVLMRCTLQLPDYLERLQSGGKDVPMALLPLLNDLRATRGQNLLSENALFLPDLAVAAPPMDAQAQAEVADIPMQALARKLRHGYQAGLVGWYRERDVDTSLARITAVIRQLRAAAKTPPVAQLFWVAQGVVEALTEKGLEANVSLKLLLGQVDRQIKRIIDAGEEALVQHHPVELVKNLLYYMASAGHRGVIGVQVAKAFNLDQLLPAANEVEAARESLSGINVDVMDTVATAVKEELGRIKDQIDLFVRSENPQIEELEPLTHALKKVADTLGMLGLGIERSVVLEQASLVTDLVAGGEVPHEDSLLEVARAFLFVESSLNDIKVRTRAEHEQQGTAVLENLKRLHGDDAAAPAEIPNAGLLSESEYQSLLSAVVAEAKTDMARAKEAIVGFISAPWEHELLKDVPQLNRQVQGSLIMLSLPRAAALLAACNDYISDDLIKEKNIPDQDTLDTLADAITSVEYYLEALEEERPDRDAILDVAQRSVRKLGYPVDDAFEEAAPPAEPPAEGTMAAQVVAFPEPAARAVDASAAAPAPSAAEQGVEEAPAQAVTQSAEAEPVATETGEEIVIEAPLEPQPEPVVSAPAAELQKPEPAVEEEIDEEILEIFLDEADEELATIREHFPRWRQEPDDADALATVRRSFHTLKGSGRMVGATAIGEFAWAFENMLNRVIDRTVQVSARMLEALDGAIAALPQLIEHFKGGAEPSADIEHLIAEAQALSQSGQIATEDEEEFALAQPEVEQDTVGAADVTAGLAPRSAGEPAAIPAEAEETGPDPVLIEIFSKESARHLGVVAQFIDQCRMQGEHCRVNDDLIRAVHTLHGSAHMAGISDIAALSNLFEKYIKLLNAGERNVPDQDLTLFGDISAAVTELVGRLAEPGAVMSGKEQLLQRLTARYDAELAAQESAEAVPAPAATPAVSIEAEAETAYEQTAPGEVDEELLNVFLEEGAEILDASEVTLNDWKSQPENNALVEQFQREIHTLKGGARMAGVTQIGDLSHSLETMVIAIVEGEAQVTEGLFEFLQTVHDRLLTMLECVAEQRPIPDSADLIAHLEGITAGRGAPQVEAAAEPAEDVQAEAPPAEQAGPEQLDTEHQEEVVTAESDAAVEALLSENERPSLAPVFEFPHEPAPESRVQVDQVRVRADLLDDLVNYSGEVSIYRSRIEQQVGAFKYNLTELEQTIERLRSQLRQFEIETEAQIMYRLEETTVEHHEDFDPLELDRFSHMQQLSRALLESVNDLNSIQALLDNQSRETETLLLQQSRVSTELQEGLMRTRMVPFSLHLPRLRRIVRQTSNELGKDVELRVVGTEGEMDRTVLDRIMAPLEHMLRNAIDHGIETPERRTAAGKPSKGTVTIRLSREGTEVVVAISDDGAGIDLDAIRARARDRGLLRDDADLTDKEVMRFITESGFSTAQEVTQISGRGVGMDVVNSEIKQLGGSLSIDTKPGQGSTFVIRLPLTLAINKALLVNSGEEIYAIPLSAIKGIVRVPHNDLQRLYSDASPRFEYGGSDYRFMHLGTILGSGEPHLTSAPRKYPLLLVQAGDHRIALHVDGLMGSRDIVVKSVGPQISTIHGISGATILADGRIALILDVGSLLLMDVAQHGAVAAAARAAEAAPAAASDKVTVMVVDDSITVRKVTSRLLERNDMRVITAKDGVDAVAALQENVPDLFLLDIEMPRMDGYELATHIRNDEQLKQIPIIMITSRTGEKHRQRALDIGVDRYLGKPYQESELLDTIGELLIERG